MRINIHNRLTTGTVRADTACALIVCGSDECHLGKFPHRSIRPQTRLAAPHSRLNRGLIQPFPNHDQHLLTAGNGLYGYGVAGGVQLDPAAAVGDKPLDAQHMAVFRVVQERLRGLPDLRDTAPASRKYSEVNALCSSKCSFSQLACLQPQAAMAARSHR